MSMERRPELFYGWFVVAAAFGVTFLGFGGAYSFSAFFESLQRDFAASRGSVSLVFSLAVFLYFGLGFVSGPLADRLVPGRWPFWGCSRWASAWRSRAQREVCCKSMRPTGSGSVSASDSRTCPSWAPCSVGSSG